MVGVLNLKMYALWGAPLTRANGYINFSKCMQAWGVCTSIHLIFFSLGNLLKPMGKPGNTWGHRKWVVHGGPRWTPWGYRQLVDPQAKKWLMCWLFVVLCKPHRKNWILPQESVNASDLWQHMRAFGGEHPSIFCSKITVILSPLWPQNTVNTSIFDHF